MNKRQRVLAAIEGKQVDHVPALFSIHFPEEMNRGEAAVKAHMDFLRQTDTDVLKIMNENLMPHIGALQTLEDWNRVERFHCTAPFMTNQMDLIKRILDENRGEAYTVATIHGICASSIHPIEYIYGYQTSRKMACEALRTHRNMMLDIHKRIADTMSELVQACIRAGVDGIYYAALGGEHHFYTDEEFAAAIKPYDLQIMQAAREAGGHLFLHMCKENLNMERYRDYGPYADVVNWGVYETNFSLEEGKKLFPGKTILGGLANRSGILVEGNQQKLEQEVRRIISEFGRTGLILGADCTLPTEIPYSRVAAAVHAALSV